MTMTTTCDCVHDPATWAARVELACLRQGVQPTVYRTLDFFLEHGFVHKIESRNAYAPCEHLGHAHHGMLLICEDCGRSEEIEDSAAMGAIAGCAASAGFRLGRVVVEAQGLCRRCAEARSAPQ